MGKLTIQEIAAVLVERNGMAKREANQFAQTMFALIQERLETDQIVKVKGLGTFKLIDVEARESVSVRTGERVTISGHSKVTFTPDATMKELVNKPFSQFETVVLNDGVEFEDIKEEAPAAAEEDTPVVEVEEPAEAPAVAVEETPVAVEEEPAVVAVEKEPAEAPAVQPLMEVTDDEQPTEEPVIDDDDDDDEAEARPWGRWLLTALGVVALMALSAYGGYYYGTRQQSALEAVPDTVVVRDTVMLAPVDSVDSVEAAADEPDAEPAQLEPEKTVAPIEPVKAEPAKTGPAKAEPADDPYAAKDARVRLGAYRIVGTEREVKVQAGQTFYSICRAHLGPDMECYVEVYNNLPQNPTIREGQTIKIPKLQLKKRRK